MANQSPSHPILCASFNQDNSCFAIGTREGFRIFDCSSGRLLYERAVGAFVIVEMLYRSSLLAIVGAGEQELNFLTFVLSVHLSRKRLIVVLQEQTFVYDVDTLEIKHIIDTVPNLKGLSTFCASLDNPYLALPAGANPGNRVFAENPRIHAHHSPLAAMTFSYGKYLGTASEQGTIIRVHLISEATESYSFRRGAYPSIIYSLSFGPSDELPDILLATSSSGSVHVFSLDFEVKERKSGSFLGSMSGSVSDTLDPAHYRVFHHAFLAGIKSEGVIRKIDKASSSSMSGYTALRASVSVITYSGYFQEFCLRINHKSEATWTSEHEFNLFKKNSNP